MCQNHVGQLIWHLNIEASERYRSCYCHKPIVQRWTTPFHGGVDGGDVGEVGEAIGGDFGSVSPSNLRWNSLCFYVSCFSAASSRERLRVFYIVIFRSS
jgi:hypothetical protein